MFQVGGRLRRPSLFPYPTLFRSDQFHYSNSVTLAGHAAPQLVAVRQDQFWWLSVYGIRASSRARLMAVASWRWYLDLVPVMRLGTILPFSVRYWRRVLRSL